MQNYTFTVKIARLFYMNIQNIIFDLGNVIINIDPELTIKAFSAFVPEKEDTIRKEVLKSSFSRTLKLGKSRMNSSEMAFAKYITLN